MSGGGDKERGVGVPGQAHPHGPTHAAHQPQAAPHLPRQAHPQHRCHRHQVHHIRPGECKKALIFVVIPPQLTFEVILFRGWGAVCT